MSLKERMKSLFDKMCGGKSNKKSVCGCGGKSCDCGTKKRSQDAEVSAEEVVIEEIYPEGKRARRATRKADEQQTKRAAAKSPAAVKKANAKIVRGEAPVKPTTSAKRTRPTNKSYKMIDPSDESADTSKS